MQIYFHSRLCSYLSRVPILVEGTVYEILVRKVYFLEMEQFIEPLNEIFFKTFECVFFFFAEYHIWYMSDNVWYIENMKGKTEPNWAKNMQIWCIFWHLLYMDKNIKIW